MFFSTQPL